MGKVVETRKTAGAALVEDTDLSVSEDSFLRELARAPDVAPPPPAVPHAPDAEPLTLVPGARIADRFRLERSLGEGGMGVVWQAVHTVTRKPVALKFLKPGKAGHDLHAVRRFMREARAACAVQHPSVVEIHDVLELPDGSPVMVMELLTGETLAQRIARERVVPLDELARIMVHVCSAVGCAHSLGIVHRDLKPENIFLARSLDGQVATKVLDFGIAKLTAHEGNAARTAATTGSQAILGTPFYMAPEQLFGERDVDHRADIWALGVILYEALSGARPTDAENMGQIYKIVVTDGVAPLRTRAPNLPAPILDLVAKMMTRERSARPADLGEVAAVLAEYTDETFRPVDVPKAAPGVDRETPAIVEVREATAVAAPLPSSRPSRRRWVVALGAVAAASAIGSVAAFSRAPRATSAPAARASAAPALPVPAAAIVEAPPSSRTLLEPEPTLAPEPAPTPAIPPQTVDRARPAASLARPKPHPDAVAHPPVRPPPAVPASASPPKSNVAASAPPTTPPAATAPPSGPATASPPGPASDPASYQ